MIVLPHQISLIQPEIDDLIKGQTIHTHDLTLYASQVKSDEDGSEMLCCVKGFVSVFYRIDLNVDRKSKSYTGTQTHYSGDYFVDPGCFLTAMSEEEWQDMIPFSNGYIRPPGDPKANHVNGYYMRWSAGSAATHYFFKHTPTCMLSSVKKSGHRLYKVKMDACTYHEMTVIHLSGPPHRVVVVYVKDKDGQCYFARPQHVMSWLHIHGKLEPTKKEK